MDYNITHIHPLFYKSENVKVVYKCDRKEYIYYALEK